MMSKVAAARKKIVENNETTLRLYKFGYLSLEEVLKRLLIDIDSPSVKFFRKYPYCCKYCF